MHEWNASDVQSIFHLSLYAISDHMRQFECNKKYPTIMRALCMFFATYFMFSLNLSLFLLPKILTLRDYLNNLHKSMWSGDFLKFISLNLHLNCKRRHYQQVSHDASNATFFADIYIRRKILRHAVRHTVQLAFN